MNKSTKRALLSKPKGRLACCIGMAALLLAWGLAGARPAKQEQSKAPRAPVADVVVLGARVITMDPRQPNASAIAIVGDRIAALGGDRLIHRWIGTKTRIIRAQGKMVLPGLIEAHGHLLGLGKLSAQLNLVGTQSANQIAQMVAHRTQHTRKGMWVLGRGWDQNDWTSKRFPTHQGLTQAAPHHPVMLRRIDGHAAWLNRRALQRAGITKQTPDPPGGQIIRDAQGHPTGILIDRAMALVYRHIPAPSLAQDKAALLEAIKRCHQVGITSFQDAGTSASTLRLLKALMQKQNLHLRVYAMLMGSNQKLLQHWLTRGPEIGLGHQMLTIRSIKLLADGALGSRGAALLEPYADKPKQRGLSMYTTQALTRYAVKALRYGFQLAIHAIGDKANRDVLDAYERAFRAMPWRKDPRFRIEHAQILAASDIPRFARLGVIPSMQPTHATSDMPWVHQRLGIKRAQQGAYVWQSLLKTGARIAAGSDAPVESVNPFWGIYAAITRQDPQGYPKGGWYPKERMTRIQALRAYTLDAAYAAFEEHQKGSLAPGKLADLILIDRDLLKITPRDLRHTKVLLTMIGGRIVYQQAPHKQPNSRPTSRHTH